MFPFFTLSYTIFFLCSLLRLKPFQWQPLVILMRCRLCCFVIAKLVHFPISDKENLLFQAVFSSIIDWRQCYWHVSNDLIDLHQCFELMYINLPNHHDYEKEFLPINKVIELAKVKQNLSVFAYISIVIRLYEVSYIPTTWSITLKRTYYFLKERLFYVTINFLFYK